MSMFRNIREAFVEGEFVCDIMDTACILVSALLPVLSLWEHSHKSKPAVASLSAGFLRDHQQAC